MTKTTQETINGIVWKACDTFRTTMDSSQYKDYVLTMLFVKYLSDFYKEKLEELTVKYGDNQDRIQKSLNREKFKLDEKCTFEYILKHKEAENLGEVIDKVLERIEEDNKEKLDGVFREISFNSEAVFGRTKEKNKILKNLLEDFDDVRLDLRPSMLEGNDVIGDSYEYLISHFAGDAGKKGGEFFTPSNVSKLLSKLVEASEGDRIYDPTCGSGSLLIKASKEVGNNNFRLYGQESKNATVALCKMNMFLHDINDAVIEWGDTIGNPLHLEADHLMKFDVVIANPPFSLDKWGAEEATDDKYKRFERGVPPKSKGDYAFIQHMVASLNENGRMGVVLPHGVLFRGASEGRIRKQLIEENLLDAIISLPANLFFGTNIPATILVFKKQRDNTDILFIDASSDFNKDKNQNNIDDEHINKILETYKNKTVIEKYSHLATLDEIKENDYNLNIPRYVDTFEEEAEVDIESTKQNIKNIENELVDIKSKMSGYLNELGL
ncbi:type I restriction-modification system subunit M [Poseidonibacter lekithochrous]|uniref:type I restriction-modification system subunit M n=1 Tax=Poseidonibacter TaxID=2321187 RepID=UPI001C081565|nr:MULTISPECIES: type I restriction-modification system subunit M [Poseidonibacter]MBU3014633.1 type I restriction-modification system subunit M [Poseidonibacter lekithochrous]MDO6827931.1 type I restriction-modification system subunit M [Poseidonibacter sp. 1_MG-2023]